MAYSIRYEDRIVERIASVIEEAGFGVILDEQGSQVSPGFVFMVTEHGLTAAALEFDVYLGADGENSMELIRFIPFDRNGEEPPPPIICARSLGVEPFIPRITEELAAVRKILDGRLELRLDPAVTQKDPRTGRGK